MIRVLFVARYRAASQQRKVDLLRCQPDLAVWQVRPTPTTLPPAPHTYDVPLLGNPDDPHRVRYAHLAAALRAARPQIIHAEEEPDSLAALHLLLLRARYAPRAILILNTWQNILRPRPLAVRLITRLSLLASAAICCASREAVAVLRQLGYQRAAPLLPAIGVDLAHFPLRPHEPPTPPLVVGYAGRLVPEKGIDTLIDAAAQLVPHTPLRLVLAGTGDDALQAALAAQAQQAGVAAHFAGAIPPDQIGTWLHTLHVLVLPSRTTSVWKEQYGRILSEAMACGVPVIGSDSGAIPDVIGSAGQTFPEGDAHTLAAHLRRLASDATLRQQMAQAGYQRVVQHYSQQQIAARTAALYRMLHSIGHC